MFIIALFLFHSGYAQLRIEECYEKAEANYPLIKQYGLVEKSKDYSLSNAGKGYLPQVQVSAKATYQSEVTEIPLKIEGIRGMDKDQYSATVEVSQSIWDGGNIKARKESLRTQSEVEMKNIGVTLYSVRQRVNQLFFGILLQEAMLNQNTLYLEELQRNYTQVSAYVQNGIANQADLDAIEVEQVKTTQKRTELDYSRKAYLEMLSALTGEKIDGQTRLVRPETDQPYSLINQRPELILYEAQLQNLESQTKEVNAALMPRLGAFVTGGYGKPGLNMLEDKFSAYYIGGVSLSWNPSSLYTRKNKMDIIKTNKSMVENQRETFLFNNNLDITQSGNEIQKMRQMLASDDHIIRLRGSVKSAAEVKVANGTLSVLDLMKEVNAEQQARQDKIVHEIELLQAIYNLKYITNN